ncbi:MAG TPA: LLM class flavin-dependent oxidoreductase [Burkholderiales bacterium]|nr:LLM class flavin-dependent oxidoreductase [Burkholderiales bacterium]
MLNISLATDGRETPDVFLARARAAELAGASRVWIANHLFERDPVSLAVSALGANPRLAVSLMAVSPFTVHPVQCAMAAATLDEIHPGRVTLCLGVGAPLDLASLGLAIEKPLRPMREALEIVRALLAGESVSHAGQSFKAVGRRLASGRRDVPIVLAASGPQMLELAGAAGDGVLISAGASVEFVRWCLSHVERGAKGRSVRRCGMVYAAVDADREAAYGRMRRLLAVLLRGAHHRMNLDLAGTQLDQEALRKAVAAGDWERAEGLITEDVIARHAVCGTPGEVKARIAAYGAAGLDELVLSGARDVRQTEALLEALL